MLRQWTRVGFVLLILTVVGVISAQDATPEPGGLAPFESEQFGIQGMIPADWTDAGNGIYLRDPQGGDPTTLIVQAAPVAITALQGLLTQQLGLDEFPADGEAYPTDAFAWTIYTLQEFEAQGNTLVGAVALAEADGITYIVVLLTTPSAAEALGTEVFLPVVDALRPLGEGVDTNVYVHPEGLFSVPIPTNWTAEQADGYGVLTDPDDLIRVYVLASEGNDIDSAVQDAWVLIDPEFALEADEPIDLPTAEDVEEGYVYNYDSGDDAVIYQAIAFRHEDVVYMILIEGDYPAAVRRSSQINVIASGFDITATATVDLTGIEALPFDEAMQGQLEAFINEQMQAFNINGAVVAVVQDGAVVYINGFGERDSAGNSVTPQTRMMIGSTTKTFTTLLMATLVDDGLIQWNTPAVEILPTFALADAELTQEITMQNLVCACTGVPRRDFELIFTQLTPQQIVESLATFETYAEFGATFQYSNQMVATGGYLAALADGGSYASLFEDYSASLQARILDPLSMTRSTMDFESVLADDNYAQPHGININGEYVEIPVDYERFALPVAPAGALWSTGEDMAQYMIMEMNRGVAADGTRIVSEENLAQTWQPQVQITAQSSYGLGWFVEDYQGLPLLNHGGNTLGFSSDFAFLPDQGVGVIVITNGQATNAFNVGVRTRVFEVVLDQPEQAEEVMRRTQEQIAEAFGGFELGDVDQSAVQSFIGTFTNAELGTITISYDDGVLLLDAGEFQTELRPLVLDEEAAAEAAEENRTAYIMVDPPLTSSVVLFGFDEDDTPVIKIGVPNVQEYDFTLVP